MMDPWRSRWGSSGRVQGVWSFRWETQRQADRLGVTGWVRNEPDGSVAGHFEGERAGELVDLVPSGAGVRPGRADHRR